MKTYQIPNQGGLNQKLIKDADGWFVKTELNPEPIKQRATYLRHMGEAGGGARGGAATVSHELRIHWANEFCRQYGYAMESPEELKFLDDFGYSKPSISAWIHFRKEKYGNDQVSDFQERIAYAERWRAFQNKKLNDRDFQALRTDGGKRL